MRKYVGIALGTVGAVTAFVLAGVFGSIPKSGTQLRFIGMVMEEGCDYEEWELINASHENLYYMGYSPQIPSVKTKIWDGLAWQEPKWLSCGTGLSAQELVGGGRVRFKVWSYRDESQKFGVIALPKHLMLDPGMNLDWLPEWLGSKVDTWLWERRDRELERRTIWSPGLPAAQEPWTQFAAREFLSRYAVGETDYYGAVVSNEEPPPDPFAPATSGSPPPSPAPAGPDPFAPSGNGADPFAQVPGGIAPPAFAAP